MRDLFLDIWKTVAPLNDPDAALQRLCELLRFDHAVFRAKSRTATSAVNRNSAVFPVDGGTLELFFSPNSFRDAELLEEAVAAFEKVLRRHDELQELVMLREAAEAEKQAALARLGRKEIGDEIVGREGGLRQVFQRAEQVAASDLPVLIVGETGTGKELVARMIHHRSKRSKHPFHRVNCGAIPSELIDSQLFGHERGSFTGATDQRKGWFERADGGTLFLDEVGELPLAAQVRLLRILQDGHYERVGGQKTLSCDVRILTATNRDLSQMVAEERFRADLWYRIAVFPIRIPPLRERTEDIPDLAEHFADRAAIRFGLSLAHPTAEDIRLLSAYSWPGNVREFGSVIDRAAILGNGRRLDIAASLGTSERIAVVAETPEKTVESADPESVLSHGFDELVRHHIEETLKSTLGRVGGPFGAAKILGLNPNTLRSKMRKLGIDPRQFKDG